MKRTLSRFIRNVKVKSTLKKTEKKRKKCSVVSVTGSVELPYAFADTLAYINTIENLSAYEPKLLRVRHVKKAKDVTDTGYYISTGLFAGVPFRGKFSYQLKKNGFHSEMETGLLAGHMNGGFRVAALTDSSSRLDHYEVYELVGWKRPFAPVVKKYLDFAMYHEMCAIIKHTQQKGMGQVG